MRYIAWAHIRAGRLLSVLLALVIYLLLLSTEALQFFPQGVTDFSSVLLFGFSAFVALLFLAVGALVWLYARSRRVALLLFCFSFTMMVTFAAETGAVLNNPLFTGITASSSALSLPLFAILLLLFPKNFLLRLQASAESDGGHRYNSALLLRWYLAILTFLSIIVTLYSVLLYSHLQLLPLPDWLNTLDYSYYLFVLAGILITIIVSYRQSSSLRERQQRRIFVGGVILTFAPLLILTMLPLVLNLPSIGGQLSTITFVVLPLALGYSILRYQILVLDMYVRRAVAWIVGCICLAVLGYLVFAFSSIVLSNSSSTRMIYVILAMAALGPLAWWLAQVMTDNFFFREISHYRRLIDQPALLPDETFDIDGAARLITTAAVSIFETQEVCLFVFDEETGYYQLYPTLRDDDLRDAPRRDFAQRLYCATNPSALGDADIDVHASRLQSADWLTLHKLIVDIIERLSSANRPLLLSEAAGEMPTGIARYLATTAPLGGFNPLLAPIRAQGKLIAILVLGERGDHQHYAGPDFEAIYLIQSRFSPVLETARLYAQVSRHVAVLDALYTGLSTVGETFQSVEDIAIAYTRVAAEAVQARAEIWLFDQTNHLLRSVIHIGHGPCLVSSGASISPHEGDWSSWFYQGNSTKWEGSSTQVPPSLPQTPSYPFAWLPLSGAQQQLGVLTLTYPRPHLFSQEERRVLSMYADQFAAALSNATFTAQLRAAYERQKELDRLKDQFITTASHELRTPLTAVMGYIELLGTYNEDLPLEKRAEFIAKAHRGCDELTLVVGNIMEAGRVESDIANLNLSPVPLAQSVVHILEILEAVTQSQHRYINMAIPDDVWVMADDLRLRQVLLNLMSNAIKYSPEHTNIDLTCDIDEENITVRVRDRGLGVPPYDQERLFGRFVRLERDLNSPTRGAGLGLHISKQLVEAMGGRIWVESTGKPGEGSTFAFTLKRASMTQTKFDSTLVHQQAL